MTRPIVGPMPTPAVTPILPTPWRVDTSDWQNDYIVIRDASGRQVTDLAGTHSTDIAQAIVDAINAQHSTTPAAPVLRDFRDSEGDTWIEVAPGKVVLASYREDALERIRNGYETRDLADIGFQPFVDIDTGRTIPEHR